jgi:hypothetical protein
LGWLLKKAIEHNAGAHIGSQIAIAALVKNVAGSDFWCRRDVEHIFGHAPGFCNLETSYSDQA